MEADIVSLFVIIAVAFICPMAASLVPKKLIPETALLLLAGMIIGPNVLDIAQLDKAINLLSDLGLGFLFLLAGYEINPKKLGGAQGRYGFATWVVSFGIALGVLAFTNHAQQSTIAWFASAIALTTTAFGTLVPILHERGIMGTRIGDSVLAYGTWGEICPVIAIALVLTARTTLTTLLILGAFAAVAVVLALIPKMLRKVQAPLFRFINKNAETNAQMGIRTVMVLLVGLLALSAVMELDLVLGAFAAGFILRFVVPEGDELLEKKLSAMGYGLFIPLFFVVSGMSVNPAAVASNPLLLVLFIAGLLLIRALPIFVAMRLCPETRDMSMHSRATVALYCATALPLVVAVTTVAVGAGAMTQDVASLLVAAAGITVFLMPLLASLTFKFIRSCDAHGRCDAK